MLTTRSIAVTGFVMLLSLAGRALGQATPEMRCQGARTAAAGALKSCQAIAFAKWNRTYDHDALNRAASSCRVAYTKKWPKLQARFPDTTCAAERFVDNGDGTVTDDLTGLVWENKENLDSTLNLVNRHDADNYPAWSSSGTAADGPAFSSFLAALNSNGCFAGQCDWRLPTREELQTILNQPYPCNLNPCIDSILGPTQSGHYWSASSGVTLLTYAWDVDFRNGRVDNNFRKDGSNNDQKSPYVRAVRGGL